MPTPAAHWLAWLLLGALTGLLAGAVVASFAAARRVDSVYDRFVAATNGFDALVTAECDVAATDCVLPADAADRLLALDGVADAVPVRISVQPELLGPDGANLQPNEDSCADGAGQVLLMSSPDGRFGTEINRFLLLEGRLPSGPYEVALSEPLARRGGLVLGDRIIAYPGPCEAGHLAAHRTELQVVGIGLATGEVQPEQGFYYAGVHGTTALSDRLVELGGRDTTGFALLLREEATAAEIVAAAGQRGLELDVLDQHEIAAGVNRGLDPEEGSLAILFLVGSIAIIALLGPVIGRHARVALREAPLLRALGATRREIVAVGGGHGVAIAVIAAPLVITVVLGSSWFTPPGRAGLIEPDPGPRLDVVLVGLALVALFALVVGCTGIAAWTAARRQRPLAPGRADARLPPRELDPPPAQRGRRHAAGAGTPAGRCSRAGALRPARRDPGRRDDHRGARVPRRLRPSQIVPPPRRLELGHPHRVGRRRHPRCPNSGRYADGCTRDGGRPSGRASAPSGRSRPRTAARRCSGPAIARSSPVSCRSPPGRVRSHR